MLDDVDASALLEEGRLVTDEVVDSVEKVVGVTKDSDTDCALAVQAKKTTWDIATNIFLECSMLINND